MRVADWRKLGVLPLQDHRDTKEKPHERASIRCARVESRDEFHRYQLEGHKESDAPVMTLGDLLGGIHVRRDDKKDRKMGAWFFAAPGISTTASKEVRKKKGSTRTEEDEKNARRAVGWRPVGTPGWTEDDRFEQHLASIKDDLPSFPKGTPLIVLATTQENKQRLIGFPVMGNKLIAVNNAGDPALATLVYDLTDEDEPDDERAARLHTFWRVMKLGSGCSLGNNDALAWQFTLGGKDKYDGRGLVVDTAGKPTSGPKRPQVSAPSQSGEGGTQVGSVTLVADYNARQADRIRRAQNGEPLKSQVRDPKKSKVNPVGGSATPTGAKGGKLVVASMTARNSGPIEVGDNGDVHRIGSTKDGLPVNAAHLHCSALWKNSVGDGPMDFEAEAYEEPTQGGPFTVPVHLRWDPASVHNWACGVAPGKWRWLAESFFYIPWERESDTPWNHGPEWTDPPASDPLTEGGGGSSAPPDECQTTPGGGGTSAVGTNDPPAYEGGFDFGTDAEAFAFVTGVEGPFDFGTDLPGVYDGSDVGDLSALGGDQRPSDIGDLANADAPGPGTSDIGDLGDIDLSGFGTSTGGVGSQSGGSDAAPGTGGGGGTPRPFEGQDTSGFDSFGAGAGVGVGGTDVGSPGDPTRPGQKSGGANEPAAVSVGGGGGRPEPETFPRPPQGVVEVPGGVSAQVPDGAGFTVFGGSFAPATLRALRARGTVDKYGRPQGVKSPRVGDGSLSRLQRFGGAPSRAPSIPSAMRFSGGMEVQPYAYAHGQDDFTRGGWIQNSIYQSARSLPVSALASWGDGDGSWESLVPGAGAEALEGGVAWLPGNGAQPEVLQSLLGGDYNIVEGGALPTGPGSMQQTHRTYYPGTLSEVYFATPAGRSTRVQGAGGVRMAHTVNGLEFQALNGSTGAESPQSMVFGQAGLDVTADVFITGTLSATGKVTFDDLIDPTGLELTPQGSDPIGGSDYGIWVRDSDKALVYSAAGSLNVLGAGGGGVSRLFTHDGTSVGNVGAGEDTLITYTLPADSLPADGDELRITVSGDHGSTTDTHLWKLHFGGTVIHQVQTNTIGGWDIRAVVTRTGAAAQESQSTGMYDNGTATTPTEQRYSPAETLSGTIVIKVTGQVTTGAFNNDTVVAYRMTVEKIVA